MTEHQRIGADPYWDDLAVGMGFRTAGRTIPEAYLVALINLSWLTEEPFANAHDREEMAL